MRLDRRTLRLQVVCCIDWLPALNNVCDCLTQLKAFYPCCAVKLPKSYNVVISQCKKRSEILAWRAYDTTGDQKSKKAIKIRLRKKDSGSLFKLLKTLLTLNIHILVKVASSI